ncbi:MAG: hypothetical protein ABFS37_02470 [Acidobacteriota bacterium]
MATISTVDNALDSLGRIPAELGQGTGPMDFKGVLYWGWHAVALLSHHRLRPARETFDHWFWDFLEAGEPAFDVERDALWEEKKRLSLIEILDILSSEELPILKPEFFQGWQDRTTRCRTLRKQVTAVIGTSVGQAQRDQLVLLLAAYHRLLRLPSTVELESSSLRAALPALFDLTEALIDRDHDHSAPLLEAVAVCRQALLTA